MFFTFMTCPCRGPASPTPRKPPLSEGSRAQRWRKVLPVRRSYALSRALYPLQGASAGPRICGPQPCLDDYLRGNRAPIMPNPCIGLEPYRLHPARLQRVPAQYLGAVDEELAKCSSRLTRLSSVQPSTAMSQPCFFRSCTAAPNFAISARLPCLMSHK